MPNIGIVKEYRSDEKRTPLVPQDIELMLKQNSNLNFLVQPSKNRCFSDEEYLNKGAKLSENLDQCDYIFGVKEIEPTLIIPNKSYIFFSHTAKVQSDNSAAAQGTPGMDKKELLKEIEKKNITLIDYENIRDNTNKRYLGFGRFAGIVGCYNSLNLYLETFNLPTMPRAFHENSYEILKQNVAAREFPKAKIVITGDGRVARGSLEFMKYTKIKEISPQDYINKDFNEPVFCNLPTSCYTENIDGKKFELQHFINFPKKYISILDKYMKKTVMLISSHYWDPNSPKLFDKKNIYDYKNLKVIGDITCDINGSIPTTIRSTSIENPYFYLNKSTFLEDKKNNNTFAIMAVDNLPSELPRDSSMEFSSGIVNEVMPYLIGEDDGRIERATITAKGQLLPRYSYLKSYINN